MGEHIFGVLSLHAEGGSGVVGYAEMGQKFRGGGGGGRTQSRTRGSLRLCPHLNACFLLLTN
ncbi:MAG TPA: hypothetical protein PKD27_10045, partial [Tepidiformaceae bacterium]|nr:hypothetical protein [Tepidiformaceae bacterium]